MNTSTAVILVHQLLFQGLFLAKNISLKRKLVRPIRGRNREASLSVAFFVVFILTSGLISLFDEPWATSRVLSSTTGLAVALVLLTVNVVVGVASLVGLKDSWRVGVVDEQTTELVEDGIYRLSRNPYFLSYLTMFAAYTVLLQNIVLLVLSFAGFGLIHWMVLREERHLIASHGDAYREYRRRVSRYLVF